MQTCPNAVDNAGFESVILASRTRLLHRMSLKSLAFRLYSHSNNPDRSRRSRGYSGVGSSETGLVSTKDFSVDCGDTQHPILAIGRTGDSPARRIARLTVARDSGSKPLRPTPPNLRYSAIFCDAAADGFGITPHWSPKLRRRSTRTG